MVSIAREVDDWFAEHGPLSSHVQSYRPRVGQIEMAQAVYQAIQDGERLMVEAGTGTGKTFAYLLPVLHAGRKTIVSTGTRNLQDQLFHRDLPMVTSAFGQPVKIALLKGRSNYLCRYRLEQAGLQSDAKFSRRQLGQVMSWSRQTKTGDTAELTGISEKSPIWPWVTSTADNCLGQDCPLFNECHVVKARRAAQAADVVVVNHHLLLADMRLKEEGFGELLPGVDVVILDEAHQFPEIAASFFGSRISARQITGICRDTVAESFAASIDRDALEVCVNRVKASSAHLRQSLGFKLERNNLNRVSDQVIDAIADLASSLIALEEKLLSFDGHSSGLDGCRRRALEAAQTLLGMKDREDSNAVAWVETTRGGYQLQRSPLDVSQQLQSIVSKQTAWVFTSATLAVRDDFSHFSKRMGLQDPIGLSVKSNFNYKKNSLLLVPDDMPEPNAPNYTQKVVQLGISLIDHLSGGAFFLFTSYRALNKAKEIIESHQKNNRLLAQRTILVQGQQPRDELLRQFREDGHAVLLGTSSFWEGVDVRGDALSLVIIDKLPFASPGDPLLQARLDAMKKQGENPFMDYQLPTAVLSLKQGVGRLIRDVDDRGLCVMCDPRLFSKAYGKTFLASLPAMPLVRDAKQAVKFLKQ